MNAHTAANLTRLAGSTALAALLLYGGVALAESAWSTAAVTATVVATLVGVAAATWGLSLVDASRAAQGAVFVLLGLAPIATFVGWMLTGNATGLLMGLLWLNLVAGLATTALTGWFMMSAPAASGPRAARV